MGHYPDVTAEFLMNPGPAVSPITGNTEHGTAAYDPTTGEALYAVYHNDSFRLFRTTTGYRQLVLEDDSVTEIATILTGPYGPARNIGLTWIHGVLYATIVGVDLDTTADRAGMWIYRCTTSDYSTWVLHGTVHEMAPSTVQPSARSASAYAEKRWAGEIFVHPNGVWSVSHHYMVSSGGFFVDTFIDNKAGISSSSDSGATWDQDFNIASAGIAVDGIYDESIFQYSTFDVFNGACNIGQFGGYAYAGWVVSDDGNREMHFRSDGTGWNKLADMGIGGNSGYQWPFSLPTRIYAEQSGEIYYSDVDPQLVSYSTTGVDLNTYGLSDSPDVSTHFCNIHTGSKPYLIATKLGKIVGVGYVQAGWVIGRVGATW